MNASGTSPWTAEQKMGNGVKAPQRLQVASLVVSEELNAYQKRHAR
jgi:hypothetical protein